jgi:excisionase family DNA binding protein
VSSRIGVNLFFAPNFGVQLFWKFRLIKLNLAHGKNNAIMEQVIIINADELKEILQEVITEKMSTLFAKYVKEPIALTRDEAAKRLGVNPQTISAWIKQGRLQNRGTGRKILLFDNDVDGLRSNYSLKHNKNW